MVNEIKKPNNSKTKAMTDGKTLINKKDRVESKSNSGSAKDKVAKEIKAKARFIRISPRKVRLVVVGLAGLEAEKALDYLRFVNKAAVKPMTKLIKSAMANAEHNFQLDKKDLYIKKIIVNDGPVLKRFRPRAHGRSSTIRKRSSHIELILGVRPGAKQKISPKKEGNKEETKKETIKIVKPDEVKKESPKIFGKNKDNRGKENKGFFKGIFQRKTG